MNAEYQAVTDETKPASSPKKGQGKRKPAPKRVRGYRPKARNQLYVVAAEFKRRHPKVTAAAAWAHFAGLAGLSAVVLSYSAATNVIEYVPDSEKWGVRRIKRDSFERRYRTLPAG